MDYEANIDWLLEFNDLHDSVWSLHCTDKYTLDTSDPIHNLLREEAKSGAPYRVAYVTSTMWIAMCADEGVRDLTVRTFKKAEKDWPIGIRATRRDLVKPAKVDYLAITRGIVGRP